VRAAHRVETDVELLEIAAFRVEDGEVRESTGVVRAEEVAVIEEGERAHSEDPCRIAELGDCSMEHRPLSVPDPFEVPPAAAVAGEHEVA
jgi:hypothetical protein